MSDEPQLTAPGLAPADPDAHPAPTPPPVLPPDDVLTPPAHGHTLRASRPRDAFVPVRRWELHDAAELRRLRGDLREQLAASARAAEGAVASDSVVLVTSELATNALAHGRLPAQVRLLVDGSAVAVVVSDADTTHAPFLAEGREPGDGGFGLQIAQRLSADVGWWTDASGKHVWAVFDERAS